MRMNLSSFQRERDALIVIVEIRVCEPIERTNEAIGHRRNRVYATVM
jgi:hypothetical protein